MTLPKNKSRVISVEDIEYRWAVSPDSGFMDLVVELAEDAGQRLEMTFLYGDDPDPVAGAGTQFRITPEVVERAIVVALEQGWQPSQHKRAPIQLDAVKVGVQSS